MACADPVGRSEIFGGARQLEERKHKGADGHRGSRKLRVRGVLMVGKARHDGMDGSGSHTGRLRGEEKGALQHDPPKALEQPPLVRHLPADLS